jgi:hypothetical protein
MHGLIVWKETPYLEGPLFVHGSEAPSLLVPCSKPTAPFETSPPFVALPSPNALFTPTRCLFTYRPTLTHLVLLQLGKLPKFVLMWQNKFIFQIIILHNTYWKLRCQTFRFGERSPG